MKFIKPEFEKIALNNLDVVLIASNPSAFIDKTDGPDFGDSVVQGLGVE